MNRNLVAFKGTDFLFQLVRELTVIERLASLRMQIEQRRNDHARLTVVGDKIANDSGTGNVPPQFHDGFITAVVIRRHDRAATDSVLGDFLPTNDRHPQRFHPGTVDARNEVQRIVYFLQNLQIFRVVNIALFVFDDDTDAVAQARKLILICKVILDIRAAARNHPFEAGIYVYASSEVTKYGGSQQADHKYKYAIIKDNPLEKPAGRFIEITNIRNYGHSSIVLLIYHFLFSLNMPRY